MYSVAVISILVCLFLVFIVLTNPSFNIGRYHIRIFYWSAPLIGALTLLIFRLLPVGVMWQGLTSSGSINPLKILTLFISMTTLSIYLDEVGFFSYVAGISLRFAGKSQLKLFTSLFLLVSVLTVFTSNDIIILTFTPFICYFSKKAKIDPMPYLFGEFVAANTFSMMLIIGNPTNIYLASSCGIGFGQYTFHMFVPTMMAGITAYILLLLVFKNKLKEKVEVVEEKNTIRSKGLMIIGLVHLSLCTVLLVISSYIGLEMWYITLGFALSLFVCVTIYKKLKRIREHVLLHTLVRAPWELIPFVLSMFVMVLGLEQYGLTKIISDYLGSNHIVIKYGILSFLAANFMNNIPMSVAFSSIVSNLNAADYLQATYASIVGSNLGAYFTPLGALAGIMWAGILAKMGVKLSFRKYISIGVKISFPVLLVTLLCLL